MRPGVRPIGEDDLQAFIDGRLAPDRRGDVETYLAAHPSVATQVSADIDARGALRAHLAFKADEPIPARLRVANIRTERRSMARPRFSAVAAAAAWLVVGAGAGWFGNTLLQGERMAIGNGSGTMTGDAIAAYRTFVMETLHPVEVRADQEAHLVQWLSRRLGKPVFAPNLTGQGFRLMGGRLLPAAGEPAAMFMYEDERGTRLTLYTRPGGQEAQAAFRFEAQGDVSAFSWIEQGLSYVVTARTDRARLLNIAELVEAQVRQDSPIRKNKL